MCTGRGEGTLPLKSTPCAKWEDRHPSEDGPRVEGAQAEGLGTLESSTEEEVAKLGLEGLVATGGGEEVLEVGRIVGGRETERRADRMADEDSMRWKDQT